MKITLEPGTAAFQPPKEWTAGKPSFRFRDSLHFILTRIGTMRQMAFDVSRQRFGVRRSSAAFGVSGDAESARGLAQSKTWRSFPASLPKIRPVDERFMVRPQFLSERGASRKPGERAFSLLEVTIAMAIFFAAAFAILSLTSQSLAQARNLQTSHVDIGGLAAMLALTNRLEEGRLPREIIAQFENFNPGYSCEGNIAEVSSNGLFQVDFEVAGLKGKKVVGSTMSILLYRPGSPSSFGNRRLGR